MLTSPGNHGLCSKECAITSPLHLRGAHESDYAPSECIPALLPFCISAIKAETLTEEFVLMEASLEPCNCEQKVSGKTCEIKATIFIPLVGFCSLQCPSV